jgi:hypothetical protein
VSSVQTKDLKRPRKPFQNQIFAFTGPVDDKKVCGAIQRDQWVMPNATTIVDPLARRRSERDNPARIKRPMGRNDNQHLSDAKRRNQLAPERMALHNFKPKWQGCAFGSRDANACPAAVRRDVDCGKVAMDLDRSAVCEAGRCTRCIEDLAVRRKGLSRKGANS